MRDIRELVFEPFHLDLGAERLWWGEEALRLTAKVFAVLRYLGEHPGQLVTKAEIIEAIWALPYVSDAALTVCIGEIRRVLGDSTNYAAIVVGRLSLVICPLRVIVETPYSH